MQHNITINGEGFTLDRDGNEFFWIHNVAGEPGSIWKESETTFPTMAAALADAEAYMARWEQARHDREDGEWEDGGRYEYERELAADAARHAAMEA